MIRLMYEDDVGPNGFFSGNIHKIFFSDKRKLKFKKLYTRGFWGPKVSMKFWGYAVGIDFET